MRTLALSLIALLLVGCETTPLTAVSYPEEQRLIREIIARCKGYGIKPDTPEQKQCFAQEVRAEQYRRNQNIIAKQNAHRVFSAMAVAGANQPPPTFSPVYTGPQQVIIQAPQPTLTQTLNSMKRNSY